MAFLAHICILIHGALLFAIESAPSVKEVKQYNNHS